MPNPIHITFPHPCSQSWDEMTLSGSVRHCDHCRKTVIDFTTWSDAALYKFFAKNDGHVCGRYFASQLDKPIPIPYQPYSRLYRLTIAMGLTLMVAGAQGLHAQSRPPLTAETDTTRQKEKRSGGEQIRGQVLDEKNEPIIEASIQAFQNGALKGGTITDYDGNYVIKPLDPGVYNVRIASMGFDTVTVNSVAVGFGTTNLFQQIMKRTPGALNGVMILGGSIRGPLIKPYEK